MFITKICMRGLPIVLLQRKGAKHSVFYRGHPQKSRGDSELFDFSYNVFFFNSSRINFVWWRAFHRRYFTMHIIRSVMPFSVNARGVIKVYEYFLTFMGCISCSRFRAAKKELPTKLEALTKISRPCPAAKCRNICIKVLALKSSGNSKCNAIVEAQVNKHIHIFLERF